jgi:hypothetical protein
MTKLAKGMVASLPVLCVAVIVLREVHWIGNRMAIAIFFASLIPLATAKAFLELREREERAKQAELTR